MLFLRFAIINTYALTQTFPYPINGNGDLCYYYSVAAVYIFKACSFFIQTGRPINCITDSIWFVEKNAFLFPYYIVSIYFKIRR